MRFRGEECHRSRHCKRYTSCSLWQRVERLSDGDRLWYRVGALIASEIETDIGTSAFRELPRHETDAFFHRRWPGRGR
jgi:hypothetical protein